MDSYDVQAMKGVAVVMAAVARVNARVAGMVAENQQRAIQGSSPAYVEDAFVAIIEDQGIGNNTVARDLNP